MNNALVYIGGFLVVVLSALFAVPHFVDWNSYRGVFEEEATRVLGRDVRIGGAVNLRLLPAPYVSVERLKIADPESTTGESLFRADSFTVWLSVPPLLKGVLEANKVEIKKPVVQLVASPKGGNWQSLTINAGQLPLMPKGVSLQSVTITDGALAVGTADRPELQRLDNINGELAADALTGPYKFTGTLESAGGKRDVRVSTSAVEAGQELRFKATIVALDTGNTYTVNGRSDDLKTAISYEGDLTAELNTGAAVPGAKDKAQTQGVPKSSVTSKIKGDASGVSFDDILITMEDTAAPQLVSGRAKVSWLNRTQVDVSLNSKWLDLDKLSGSGKAVPLDVARQVFDGLASALPDEAETRADAVLEQVSLGGDTVSDVRLSASRSGGGPLEVKGVRANLPNGARLEFDGQLAGKDDKRAITGEFVVSGQSLQRFVTWGSGRDGLVNQRADGPFSLEGNLTLSHAEVAMRDASGEIAGMPLSGEFRASLEGRRSVSLMVEGDRIDAGAILPGSLDPAVLLRLIAPAAKSEKTEEVVATAEASPASAPSDMRIVLRAAEVVDGDSRLKNVDADLSIENGALSMPKLNFTTAEGLSVELEGETKAAAAGSSDATAAPHGGQLRGVVTAADAAALAALAPLLGLPPEQNSLQRLSSLAPLRLAGSINFGERTPDAADVKLDGIAGNARTTVQFLLDKGLATWRQGPGDLTLTADSGNVLKTAASLLGLDAKATAQEFEPPRPGRLSIRAISGTAGQGYLANVDLRGEGLSAVFDGTSEFKAESGWTTNGSVQVKSDDTRPVLALAGVRTGRGAGAAALNGTIKVASNAGQQVYTAEDLQTGDTKLSGRVTMTASAVDADLAADRMSIPTLLALLTTDVRAELQPTAAVPVEPEANKYSSKKRRAMQALQPQQPQPETWPSIWAAQTFDTGLVSGLTGTIKAKANALGLEPGLELGDAVIEVALAPGRINITRLEGKALGGTVSSTLALEKDTVGLKATGSFAMNAGGAQNNDAVLKLEATGRAASPAGLIADLKGKGTLALAQGAITVNSPAALTAVAEAALQGQGPMNGDELLTAIRTALRDSRQPLGGFSVPLTIADGAMRFDKVQLEQPEGRSQFDAVVELDTLKLMSEWQIEPKVAKPESPDRQMLAPVAVVYNGKLKDLQTLEPQITTAALERELQVRKMERDVEQLEQLRKADQQRAAAELERRKALEAEQARAAAAEKAARDAANAAKMQMPPAVNGAPQVVPNTAAPAPTPNAGAPAAPVQPNAAATDGAVPPEGGAVVESNAATVPAAQTAGADSVLEAAPVPPPVRPVKPLVRKKRPADGQGLTPFQVNPY